MAVQIRPGLASSPGPGRRAALPLVVLVPPPLFLLVRELSLCPTPLGCSVVRIGTYGAVALLATAGAVVLAGAAGTRWVPAWMVPRPDDGTLAVLGAIVGSLAAAVLASALGITPVALADLLAPVGLLLTVPLVVVHATLVGSVRSLGRLPETVRLAAVAVGMALSGAWWYVLAKTVARWLADVNEPRD